MKKTLAVLALAALGVSSAQQCPIPQQTYLDFDFSNILSFCGDLGTVDGCDTCYAALVDVIKDPSLDYLDTNLSFQEFGLAAADLLEACQNNLVAGLQSDLGFSALQLRGLESCGFDFGNFPKTVGVVQEYYQSKGVDISTLVPVLN